MQACPHCPHHEAASMNPIACATASGARLHRRTARFVSTRRSRVAFCCAARRPTFEVFTKPPVAVYFKRKLWRNDHGHAGADAPSKKVKLTNLGKAPAFAEVA